MRSPCGHKLIRATLIVILLAGCASTGPSDAERENFKRVMDRQVGKLIDDPDAYPVYYRLKQLSSKPLPNGNTQLVYAAGRQGKCQVGYEVNLGRQILGWSIVEKPDECVIEPPRP